MKLRLAKTELLSQDHTGIRAGAAWLAWSGSLHPPSLSYVPGLSIITWPAFLTLHGFQLGVPNWNQIFLTLEIDTMNQQLMHRINECMSRRTCWEGDGRAGSRLQPLGGPVTALLELKQGLGRWRTEQGTWCLERGCLGKGQHTLWPGLLEAHQGQIWLLKRRQNLYILWNL